MKSAKPAYNRDPRWRPDQEDFDTRPLISETQRGELAALLGVPPNSGRAKYVLDEIDLLARAYKNKDRKRAAKSKAALKAEHCEQRQKLSELLDHSSKAIGTYISLSEDARRKLSHRLARNLAWPGERGLRALIGERIIHAVTDALASSISETCDNLELPPGKKSKSPELHVLVEGLGRIWCATTRKPFYLSDFGRGDDSAPRTARPATRAFIETVNDFAALGIDPKDLTRVMKNLSKYDLMSSRFSDTRDASDETKLEQLKRRLLPRKIAVTIRA